MRLPLIGRVSRRRMSVAVQIPLCEAGAVRKLGWMHLGDAAVRLAWKVLWSWRR